MRIRFTASDLTWSDRVLKLKQVSFLQIETGFSNEIGSRDGVGVIFVLFACDPAGRAQKIQASVGYCCVWRLQETHRVHFAPLLMVGALRAILVIN